MRTPETPELRTIYTKDEFFEMIRKGEKTLELRIGFPSFKGIRAGERIIFASGDGQTVEVKVKSTREYSSLGAVLGSEDVNKLAPGLSRADINNAAERLFKPADVAKHGLLVLEFQKV